VLVAGDQQLLEGDGAAEDRVVGAEDPADAALGELPGDLVGGRARCREALGPPVSTGRSTPDRAGCRVVERGRGAAGCRRVGCRDPRTPGSRSRPRSASEDASKPNGSSSRTVVRRSVAVGDGGDDGGVAGELEQDLAAGAAGELGVAAPVTTATAVKSRAPWVSA
jgi:hypothetical protein